jgi:hypothetical protein
MGELVEMLIREERPPWRPPNKGKTAQLVDQSHESGFTGRGRAVWYRCEDDPCYTGNRRLWDHSLMPKLVMPDVPELALPPMEPWQKGHVVEVPRWDGELLEPTMVGKVVPHPELGFVFLHAQSGSQRHFKTGCPAPVDTILLEYLAAVEWITYVYVYDRESGQMARATVDQLYGAEEQWWGGRRRRYLPGALWEMASGVTEKQYHGTHYYYSRQGREILRAPYYRGAVRILWGQTI